MPSLNREIIIDGAKQAAAEGLSFDEYAELIAKIIISGQSADEVKGMFKAHGIHLYFEVEGFTEGQQIKET